MNKKERMPLKYAKKHDEKAMLEFVTAHFQNELF